MYGAPPVSFCRNPIGKQLQVFPVTRLRHDDQSTLVFVSVAHYSPEEEVEAVNNFLESPFVGVPADRLFFNRDCYYPGMRI